MDGASSSLTGQIVIVLLSVISTGAMLWKTSRDQKHALELIRLNHEVDASNRREQAALDRADRETAAAAIRERMVVDAAAVQVQLHTSANAVRDRVEAAAARADTAKAETREDTRTALALQTAELTAAIESAKLFTAGKADAAYDVGNHVNDKLQKLNEAHAAQGEILRHLLEILTPLLARLDTADGAA